MTRYPVNRLCPLTGVAHDRVLAHVPVSAVAPDPSYQKNFIELLGLKPDDEFPIVQSPAGFVFAGFELSDDFVVKSESEATDHTVSAMDTIPWRRENLQFANGFLRTVEQHYKAAPPLKLLDFGHPRIGDEADPAQEPGRDQGEQHEARDDGNPEAPIGCTRFTRRHAGSAR